VAALPRTIASESERYIDPKVYRVANTLNVAIAVQGLSTAETAPLEGAIRTALIRRKLQVSALIDQKTAAKVGALLGAQALVFLNVLDCHGNKSQETLGTDKKGRTSYNYVIEGSISGSVRVVSLTTGQVLASQRFEGTGQAQNFEGFPDPAVAMADAQKNAAFSVHKLLLPWKETKHVVFFNDSQCDLKTAANLLKAQDIDGALKQSDTNLATCKDQPKINPSTVARAYYNLSALRSKRPLTARNC
jgi:hypothetical protein